MILNWADYKSKKWIRNTTTWRQFIMWEAFLKDVLSIRSTLIRVLKIREFNHPFRTQVVNVSKEEAMVVYGY
jgi:hypothetical protein